MRPSKVLHLCMLIGTFIFLLRSPWIRCDKVVVGVVKDETFTDRMLLDAATQFVTYDVTKDTGIDVKVIQVKSTQDSGNLLELTERVCELLQDGIHGVVSHLDCVASRVLSDLLSPHYVPVILVAPSDCNLVLPPGVFSMRPASNIFKPALEALVSPGTWVKAEVIFYDQFSESTFVENMFADHDDLWVTAFYVEGEQLQDSQKQLLYDVVHSVDYTVCLVFLRHQATFNLLDTAVELRLNSSFQTWVVMLEDPFSHLHFSTEEWYTGNLFFVSTDYQPIDQLPCPQELFHLQDHLPSNLTLDDAYVLDAFLILSQIIINSKINGSIVTAYSISSCLSNQSQDPWSYGQAIIRGIRKQFHGASGLTSFNANGYNDEVRINVWAVDKDSTRELSLRAQWTTGCGLQRFYQPMIINPPDNFRQRHLRVGVVQSAPYVVSHYNEDTKKTDFTGFCIDIVKLLAETLNFTVDYVDGAEDYGQRTEDGQWSGMIKKVINKEVEFAAGAFSITEEREEAVAFTAPFKEDSSTFILKRPHPSQGITRVFLPFHITVWTAIFIAVTLIGLLLFAVRLSLGDTSTTSDVVAGGGVEPVPLPATRGLARLLIDNLWFAYGTYVEQSMEHYPQCQSGRVLVVFWWLFTIIMSATYTANLVAYLTVTLTAQPISSLQQLAKAPDIRPLILPGNSLNDLFSNPKARDVYKELWRQYKSVVHKPNNTEEALKMVATGKYALLNDQGIIGYSAAQSCDKFVLADETFRPIGLGFAMHKESEYKHLFDTNIIKMQESGIIQKWQARWMETSSTCPTDPGVSSITARWQHMSVQSLAGAFLVLLGAVMVSLFALVLELLMVRMRRGGTGISRDVSRDTETRQASAGRASKS